MSIGTVMNTVSMDAFKKFYPKLAEVLPAYINTVVADFLSRKLLPTFHQGNLDSLKTDKEKSEYFLNKLIKSGLEVNFTKQFEEMLKVMRRSDDYAVNCLVDDIQRFNSTANSAASSDTRK